MTLGGALTGVIAASAGAGLQALWSDVQVPLAATLGAVALAYAAHEVGLVSLPVPGRDWQVPAHWVRDTFYRSAALFGGTVGMGVFTRVPYASLPILLAWLVVAGSVWFGLLAGLVYGSTRAISIYSSAGVQDSDQLVDLNQRIMGLVPAFHQMTGLALAAFGAYLLIAPTLS